MKEGKQIFEEVRVGRLRLRNRLVRSATWLGLAAPDGTLPEEAFAPYRELAEGGVGASSSSPAPGTPTRARRGKPRGKSRNWSEGGRVRQEQSGRWLSLAAAMW